MRYFADPELFTLDNGIEVYVVARPGQPSAEILGCVRTGSIHEGAHLGCGLSHFVEHMLFQGCEGFPGTSAGDLLGKLGGDANAYTSFDRTVYYVELPARSVPRGLEVLSAMLRHPEFPAKRFASERDVILREAAMGFDNPGRRLGEQCRQLLFRRHALRHPIIGYPEMVACVTAGMSAEYHAARYTPGRVFFVLAGNVDGRKAADILNEKLGDWPRAGLAESVLPPEPEQTAFRRAEFAIPDPLARLMLGTRIPGLTGTATVPYEIAAGLLGAGDAARLVRSLQFERELAVDLESSFLEAGGEALLCVSAAAEPGKCRKLESALLRELADLRGTGYSAREVAREKLQHRMETLRELRTNSGIAATVAGTVLAGESPAAFDRYMARVDAVTPDEVNAAMRKMLDPDRFCLAVQTPGTPVAKVPRAAKPAATGPVLLDPNAVWLPNRELPIADMAILLPGGDLFTDPEKSGVNALTAELLTCGSGRWSESKIAEKLDTLGADLTVSAAWNTFYLRAAVPRGNWRKLVGLLAEILPEPDFDARVFARERRAMLAEFAAKSQRPSFAALAALREMLFGRHPYANSTRIGATLPGMTADDVRDFYRALLRADRTVFAFGGDLGEGEAAEAVQMLRGALPWVPGDAPGPAAPKFPRKAAEKRIELAREQQVVALGMPAPDCLDERDYPAFQVLNDSLNGITGRLYKVIREDHALAYATGMSLRSGFCPGAAFFHASTAPESGDRVEELLRQVLRDLASKGLSEAEFREARDNEVFNMERVLAQPEECLFEAALNAFYRRPPDDLRRAMARMKALTRREVNAVLKRRLADAVFQSVRAGGTSAS